MEKMNSFQQPASGTKRGILAFEKRRHPRFNTELPLDYSRVEGKELYGGIVANASEGGLLVYLPERIEIGAFLKIEIIYVNGLELNTIEAVAKVVWQDLATKDGLGEHRYGLQFQQIDETNFNRLSALLKEVGK
jgi:c-di-GMP-binding flagellar brake protein YcgR